MIASEDILFVMPRDRELQFPAMAALQMYVNNYRAKMRGNNVTKDMPEYRLRYWTTMRPEEWDFFVDLGIELADAPQQIGIPDSVVEMSDEKILSFYNNAKHAAQICAAISGVECPPFPKIRTVQPGLNGLIVGVGGRSADLKDIMQREVYQVEALTFKDGDVLCVVGEQSWQTYAAAAMGLPVIEIVPRERGLNWLSKFKNPLYRICEADRLERIPAALKNITATLTFMEEQKCRSLAAQADRELDATSTAATGSSATPVEGISATPRYGWERLHAPSAKHHLEARSCPPTQSKCTISASEDSEKFK